MDFNSKVYFGNDGGSTKKYAKFAAAVSVIRIHIGLLYFIALNRSGKYICQSI